MSGCRRATSGPIFQVWNTETRQCIFEVIAPDLETAMKRAKTTIKIYDNIKDDPDKIFVCLAPA